MTLKVIREKYLGDEAARSRFLREARAAASVRHPNVGSVFHLGRKGRGYFYAMEFVEGETLDNLIKRSGALEVKLALEITRQVALGLSAVHKKSLVHRDIKPSNIMVSFEEEGAVTAKIIDLGLAKVDDESGAQTTISASGAFAGTPEFASPEQILGGEVDIRSDLYSLGVSLWQMLIGQVPFRGSAAVVIAQHQHAALPLERLAGVPQPVANLIEVLLSKDPARRFQTPTELLKALLITDAIEGARTIPYQSLGQRSGRDSSSLTRKPPTRPVFTGAGLAISFPPLHPLNTVPNNLPVQLTSFIGRDHEIAEVAHLLASTRLLMLTGSAGTGKTRLSLQVAANVSSTFSDGVWLVELAPLSDSSLVPQVVAFALGAREQPGRPLVDTLVDYSRAKSFLLILDNCEHLIEDCAQLVTRLLSTCAKMKILATSREALGVAGETTFQVPSLAVPDTSQPLSVESMSRYEAVRLFVERTQAAQPRFALSALNLSAIAQICRQLDGIPLALELAAIRVSLLTVNETAARLDDRFRLLTRGSRTALRRQQTLRALIDWSYDLLAEPECAALRQLSVFAGGWTIKAAEAVIGPNALELLSSLVDKSLVCAEEHRPTEQTRYHLIETIRQYAYEKLVEEGENEQALGRHANAYVQFVEAVAPKLDGPEQAHELQRVESEHDNLRSALRWAIAKNESAAALRLSGALGWFWFVRGHFSEGRHWLQQALALSRTTVRARMPADYSGWYATAIHAMGTLAEAQGDYAITQALNEESLAFFQELEDKPGIAQSLHWLGVAAFWKGDYAATRVLHEKCLALYREMGDKRGIGFSLNWKGIVATAQGDYPAARLLHEESLTLFRELGDERNIAMTLDLLGVAAFGQCNYATARVFHEESLALLAKLEDKKSIAECLPGLAAVAEAEGQPKRATKLLGAVDVLLERIDASLDPAERAGFDRTLAAARAQLDETTFNREWATGRAMTLEQTIKYALEANHDGA